MGRGGAHWATKVAALAVGAMVATAGTTMLVMCFGLIADLVSGSSTDADFGRVFGTLAFGVLWAVVLGFIGAFVALAVSMSIFGRGPRVRTYVFAGVVAGLIHSLLGVALKLALEQESLGLGTRDLLSSIIMWGGFMLTNLPGWGVVYTTIVAAMLAGALAGRVYARLIGVRSGGRG